MSTRLVRPTGVLVLAVHLALAVLPAPITAARNAPATDPAELPRPSIAALAVESGEIVVDGVFDEPAWQKAEVASGFVQQRPSEGEPASEETRFQIAYSDSMLFVALDALDSEPDKIVAKQMSRDGELWGEDSVLFMFDTFHDHRNFIGFQTNPNGVKFDALVTDEGRDYNSEWDGVWRVVAKRTDRGWQAEIGIPFSTLRFDPRIDTWGLQVQRDIARKNEESYWAPIARGVRSFRISLGGEITGLQGLTPSRQLDIKPFITADATDNVDTGSDDSFDAGLDVKWGVSKSTRLDLTYNTDFAEVEVDEQQVNLTRFSLFFPEKREFFLENAGIFEFGPSSGSFFRRSSPLLKVFFSRRIGIHDGEQVPVEWGGRYTGRAGGWNFGVLNVQTDSTDEVGKTNFAVIRAKRNIGERSSLGVILTDRNENGGPTNRVYGFDVTYNPTTEWSFSAFATASEDEDYEDDDGELIDRSDWAGGFQVQYQKRDIEASLEATQVSADYNPGIGFLLRRDVRRYKPSIEWDPIINKGFIRTLSFGMDSEYTTTVDGMLESRENSFDFFGFRTFRGDSFSLQVSEQTERLFEPFEISDGITLDPGRYDFDPTWGFRMFSSSSRPIGIRGGWGTGGFYNGTRDRTFMSLVVNPSKYFRLETGAQLNDVELPQGNFEGNVYSQRLDVSFTTNLLTNALIQYNEVSETLGINLRFNWIYKPGADLFVVFNQLWDAKSLSDRARRDTQVIVKFTYLLQR